MQNLIKPNTEMKDQISELEDIQQRNNLRFMSIKQKSGEQSKTWEESESEVKVFLQEKLGLET